MLRMSAEDFERAVEEALETIPQDLLDELENIVITVEDQPSADDLVELGMGEDDLLFGLYQGIPLTEREPSNYSGLPDRIAIFRLPLLEACRSRRELLAEIRDTVIHEVGHYFGFDEEDLP